MEFLHKVVLDEYLVDIFLVHESELHKPLQDRVASEKLMGGNKIQKMLLKGESDKRGIFCIKNSLFI